MYYVCQWDGITEISNNTKEDYNVYQQDYNSVCSTIAVLTMGERRCEGA